MKRKCLAIGIILLFVGVTIAPTINFNTVKASQQNIIKERINQKESLFQTIVDIANNKEIQRIILKSQMSRGIFPISEFPVLTKNQIRQMYFFGMILSKVISKSRIQSLVQQYQFNNQGIQKEINAVTEKDTTLSGEISQLSNLNCQCESQATPNLIGYVLCGILLLLLLVSGFFLFVTLCGLGISEIIAQILPPVGPVYFFLISFVAISAIIWLPLFYIIIMLMGVLSCNEIILVSP